MRSFTENRIWHSAQKSRKVQRFAGIVSGIFLAFALLALFDGLLAQMRAGSNELEMLPGEAMTISGPVAVKHPLDSDVLARFNPASAPLEFELEGFFTGYWFGGGMWRGRIVSGPEAAAGSYGLAITFKGASARGAQKYVIKVFENKMAMREASMSAFRRIFDLNSFITAALAGLAGIVCGTVTYYFGRKYAAALRALGLAEIYRASKTDGLMWCFAPRALAPHAGNARMVFDHNGNLLGEARAEGWEKGKLRMTMLDGYAADEGSLVCLVPPQISENSQRGKESPEDK